MARSYEYGEHYNDYGDLRDASHKQKKSNIIPMPPPPDTSKGMHGASEPEEIFKKVTYATNDYGAEDEDNASRLASLITESNNLQDEASMVVKPLTDSPENIRWMYKSENDKTWIPFSGYDSIRLENRF